MLTYADLRSMVEPADNTPPTREIELHLTGNMERYMWSINGVKFSDAKPIMLKHGERVRFVLVNDTMMTHPIHLHGLWSDLESTAPIGSAPMRAQVGLPLSFAVSHGGRHVQGRRGGVDDATQDTEPYSRTARCAALAGLQPGRPGIAQSGGMDHANMLA